MPLPADRLKRQLQAYTGPALQRGAGYAYLWPHPALRRYISCYTLSDPAAQSLPAGYTVLPAAGATMVFSLSSAGIVGAVRGANTHASEIGSYAAGVALLALVEFRPLGLYALLGEHQAQMTDAAFLTGDVCAALHREVLEALEGCTGIPALVRSLDAALFRRLQSPFGSAAKA